MKYNEVIDQIYCLAVGGVVNGKKRTKKDLYAMVAALLPHDSQPHSALLTIDLPDGRWNFLVSRWLPKGTRFFEYDYILPDTREQEMELVRRYYFDLVTCEGEGA